MSKPPISETIKAKLEEYEVERRVSELATQAEHLLQQGRARAAALARIAEFERDPTKFVPAPPVEAPPGMPIGEDY